MQYRFCEIVLPLNINSLFTYSLDINLAEDAKIGARVLINFGKNKIYTGIIANLHNSAPDFDTKPILAILDTEAFVNKFQFDFFKWISTYYCCSLGDVIKAAIPDNLIPSSDTHIFINDDFEEQINLSDIELKITDYVSTNKEVDIQDIITTFNIKNPLKILSELERKNILIIGQKLTNEFKPKLQNFVFFSQNNLKNRSEEFFLISNKKGKQFEILSFLIMKCLELNSSTFNIALTELCDKCKCSRESVKTLAEKKFVQIKQIVLSRIENLEQENFIAKKIKLSEYQQVAYQQILLSFQQNKPVLLHGVTSSGKTEIYINLIFNTLSQGKSVLYLLPEIALTTQIIQRIKQYFGNEIAVFHSKYPLNTRAEVYKEVLSQKRKIIIGVRSAIFLPFDESLGLIIIDEEHETTFKQQDPDPRYNARDIALVLAKQHNANIILGSATPSVESYYNANNQKYALVELTQRFGNVQLPQIIVADVKDGYNRKIMTSHFHPLLLENIQQTLEKGEQIILFQNRRGHSSYIECNKCGWAPYCKHCNVSLTYHKYKNRLICHYCGEEYSVIGKCENCNNEQLVFKGLGTEKIEDQLQKIFTKANIERLDYDTTTTRLAHERIIKRFENREIDILIGTQMVTKGLDFDNITLVGILNADNLLNYPDFRAFERAFQLIMQVSGRAGRREKRGTVILQTFEKDHHIIKNIIANDYKSFYYKEIELRQRFNYPPFSRFIVLKLKSKDKSVLFKSAFYLANELKKVLGKRITGPEEPLVNKVNSIYILNIHIRYENSFSGSKVKEILKQKINDFHVKKEFSSIKIEINVDII